MEGEGRYFILPALRIVSTLNLIPLLDRGEYIFVAVSVGLFKFFEKPRFAFVYSTIFPRFHASPAKQKNITP